MQQSGNLYADLAGYYDQFCADVDYVAQCAFTARTFALFAESGGRQYLDLACGTGQHLQLMQQYGFAPHGLDNSAGMLQQAALRCPAAQLQLCDLAAFTHVAAFDLITCFLYSLHYSHPTAALAETLRRAWQALKPGGMLLFNAVDARGIRNDDGIVTHLDDGASQLTFRSGWHYRGEGEVLDLALAITRTSAAGSQRWRDHHTMTAVTLPQLQHMLAGIGFDVTMLEHDYAAIGRLEEGSFNAIVIACKPLAVA